VTCPICSVEISPDTPVRRDGDALVHSNCWMRRFRQASGIAAMGASDDLVDVIRARLAAHSVPSSTPSKVSGGASRGAMCVGCGGRIAVGQIEYGVEFGDAGAVRFHRACYAVWDKERAIVPRTISGGCSPSAWTLLFDLHVARRAARDRAAHLELSAACAEVRRDACRARLFSRTVRARAAALRSRQIA
jgi:hypothetical protein